MPPRTGRSIWRGAISFGIVSIPVRLYTATEDKDISFRQLHAPDNGRVRYARFCSAEEVEIPYDEIVRGYEYEKDRYVILEDEDFEQLPLPSKNTIDLSAFVQAEEIDPVFYEKSYFLEPEETGVKPFALLMRALHEKGLTAVAKLAIRNKERLCALRPMDGTLMLETLYYPDEIRVARGEPMPKAQISDSEMKMAMSLIDLLTTEFQPEAYEDNYREALMEVIKAKLEGQEIVEAEEPERPEKIVDLMAALRASVEAVQKPQGGRAKQADDEAEERPARTRSSATRSGNSRAKTGTKTAAKKSEAPARRRKAAS
jgi:DNA end-binding protein Ku